MGLQEEIDAKRSEIRSDGYGMSIGELISLYEHDEIDIHPEFQRFFRWTIWQKSRLIESLLLGIPLPSIYVFQRDDGVWDVVDGLQRLATIFQFIGILKDAKGALLPPLKLEKTTYLPSLRGVTWGVDSLYRQQISTVKQNSLLEDLGDEGFNLKTLTSPERLLIKRSKIHISIILKESDEQNKYELFQRLNTGGSNLSDQELRNCILISVNHNMYRWLRELANDENFISCINLTDRAILEQYDVELALRFLVFRNLDEPSLKKTGDLDAFLTNEMCDMAVSKSFDMEAEGRYFKETFELLANTTRDNSFRKYTTVKDRFIGGFLVSAFEVVALGVGFNIDLLRQQHINIEEKIKQLWQTQEFIGHVGSGITASSRIPKSVALGRRQFRP